MIAAWTFWSKPADSFKVWAGDKYHYLSWILSVETARKHFKQTNLFTDEKGARILVDGIGLEFTKVTTDYHQLKTDVNWWALPKIHTYQRMQEPFIHIDSDVFLWQPLPEDLLSAPIFGQNPEYFTVGNSWYDTHKFELLKERKGWLPKEIPWYNSTGSQQMAVCCGIFGGSNLEFIQYYAENAVKLAEHQKNQTIWNELGRDIVLIEQYYLMACIQYYQNKAKSVFDEVEIRYLFDSSDDAFNPDRATEKGFTHLIGGAKKNQGLLDRLESRVQRDYPQLYERCLNVIESPGTV